jgi:predicted restriction endonuclease
MARWAYRSHDDAHNGIPLCANHHIAFDNGLWSIQVKTTRLVTRLMGPDLADLGITRLDLGHLPVLPHQKALEYVWSRWHRGADGSAAVAGPI